MIRLLRSDEPNRCPYHILTPVQYVDPYAIYAETVNICTPHYLVVLLVLARGVLLPLKI